MDNETVYLKDLVASQKSFFKTGQTRSLDYRIEQLKKLRSLLVTHQSELLASLNKDLGKSTFEGFAIELAALFEEIDLACKNLKKWAKTKRVGSPLHLKPSAGRLIKEPYGVVSVYAPWNYPVQLLLSPAIGSIAAGNCTILKPADLTAHTQATLLKMINENFPKGFLHAVGGGIPTCEKLLEEDVDFIFFTGSPRVGKIIMAAAAKHLTPVCLELGGKSPCIVDETANLKVAAKRITWAKFLNAGQTCVAPDYFYFHQKIKAPLVKLIQKEITNFYGDSPLTSPNLGNIINDLHFNRVQKYLNGENIIWGGKSDPATRKMEPTLLDGIHWSSPIMQEEIFGPILPIMEYTDLEDVITTINSKPKPLALYYFSEDKKRHHQVLQKTTSGGGCINDCIIHVGNPNIPFGGVGNSGLGSYHGRQTFELLSHTKGISVSTTKLDMPFRYPTHTEKKLKFFKMWFRT